MKPTDDENVEEDEEYTADLEKISFLVEKAKKFEDVVTVPAVSVQAMFQSHMVGLDVRCFRQAVETESDILW